MEQVYVGKNVCFEAVSSITEKTGKMHRIQRNPIESKGIIAETRTTEKMHCIPYQKRQKTTDSMESHRTTATTAKSVLGFSNL